jgi:undecaprenyl-diphosphatase
MDPFSAADSAILRVVGSFAGRHEALDLILVKLLELPLLKGGMVLGLVWYLWFDSRRDQRSRRVAAIAALLAGVLAVALSRGLQLVLPQRLRPLYGSSDFTPPLGLRLEDYEWAQSWSSLPSDHAALFFAISFRLWLQDWRIGLAASLWTLFMICVPRVYTGLHYPSDIIAGVFLAIAVALAVYRVPAWLTMPLLKWEQRKPALFYAAAFLVSLELTELFWDLRVIGREALRIGRNLAGL